MSYVQVDKIVKTYQSDSLIFKSKRIVEALKGISFTVEKGEIFGLIGPDGAGKTTLFRILNTLLLADSGTAFIDGHDVCKEYKHIRSIAGYVPGKFSLYQDLTVEENLQLFARIFQTRIEDNMHLIQDIYQQIEPFRKRKASDLSGGMKQKLALSCALIHKPGILFLDEPTTGVDPVSRKEFWAVLNRLSNEGITILVSTPYMDEAKLCDRILLMNQGEELLTNTPDNIVHSFDKQLLSVKSQTMFRLLTDLKKFEHSDLCYSYGDCFHITLKNCCTNQDLNVYLRNQGHESLHIESILPDIEDCFIHLTEKA